MDDGVEMMRRWRELSVDQQQRLSDQAMDVVADMCAPRPSMDLVRLYAQFVQANPALAEHTALGWLMLPCSSLDWESPVTVWLTGDHERVINAVRTAFAEERRQT